MLLVDGSLTAFLEAGAYTLFLAVILILVYSLPYFSIKTISGRVTSYVSWLLGRQLGEDKSRDPCIPSDGIIAIEQSTKLKSTYPRSWWTDEKTFQLERRAIFSKAWLFVTHASRFQKPGDYRTYEIAGFSFIVILGKDRQLRAFHNVCRHRAYAVTKKESGSSIVLGCRYHGWSYDTRGNLIKAPEFENVEGFDKDLNGLWELKVEIRNSMVFVNFDASKAVKDLELIDATLLLKRWKIGEMSWVAEWKTDGKFNWKLATEGIPVKLDEDMPRSLWSSLTAMSRKRQENIALSLSERVISLGTGNLLTIRLLPQSKSKTVIEFNLYGRGAGKSARLGVELERLQAAVNCEIMKLELKQRKVLGGSTDSVSDQQDRISELLEAHLNIERKLGVEVHPAARKQSFTQEGRDDDDLCKELETNLKITQDVCSASAKGDLDW